MEDGCTTVRRLMFCRSQEEEPESVVGLLDGLVPAEPPVSTHSGLITNRERTPGLLSSDECDLSRFSQLFLCGF